MINKYFKKSVFVFLSLNLLLASAGIPIYKHYCQGNFIGVQYLVEQDDFCHSSHENQEEGCCKSSHEEDEKNCCSSAAQSCSDLDSENNDCCKDELELIRLDLVVNLEKSFQLKAKSWTSEIPGVFMPAVLKCTSSQVISSLPGWSFPPGPLPDGKTRIITFQKFIC